MPLLKYKVLQADTENGIVYLPVYSPGGTMPIGILQNVGTGTPIVVFLMKYTDWAKEFPDEAKKEEEEGRRKDATNVE